MEKLSQIDKVIKGVLKNHLKTNIALEKLNSINNLSVRYNRVINLAFFGISSGGAARVFGGGFAEIIIATLIGLFAGLLIEIASFFPKFGKVVGLLAAFFAVVFSYYSTAFLGNYSTEIATITGLIILIPGFSFTVAITELINGHPIAGTARLANSVIGLLTIGLGIAIGSEIINEFQILPNDFIFTPIPDWTEWLALVLVPLGFVVLFKATPKDFVWILLACLCSFYAYKITNNYFSQNVCVFISALALGVISNVFSILSDKPASIMLVPGIILLVPGSLGFKSVLLLGSNQTTTGIDAAFSMSVIAISLVAGLIVSNIIMPTKRTL